MTSKKFKKLIKASMFIKGMTGVLATSAYIISNERAALIVMIIGAACDELVKLLKDEEL